MNAQEQKNTFWNSLSPLSWAGLALYLLIVIGAVCIYPSFTEGTSSATDVLMLSWNAMNDYEHGWLVPFICIYLLVHSCGKLQNVTFSGSKRGLWLVGLGGLFFLMAVHTQQWRIAIGGIPFMLTGAIWYYWGTKAAWRCAFPLFFLWMSIPLPGFQQATTGMQILATKAAHWGAGLFGVETMVEGTNISLTSGNCDTFNIAGGCSGMRSLMALIMLSTAWAYVADGLALWKRLILAFSAIPLSIAANAFRVASIFIFAEHINPVFASKTWHDWSGLLFFFPASLLGLMLLHGLLAGEVPFLKRRRTVSRRQTTNTEKESQI
ncbi:MAG: exosortase/archaeosortase family protein [Akkermansia sp.]|nr:exosortase/archaeosortase family protein [Akkermansia sp.]